jgi:Putative peptidoglycan binding domain
MLVFGALCLSLVTAGCDKAVAPLPGHAIHIGRYVPEDNVKDYRDKDPKGYANYVWWSIVTAQQTLARFGYGTKFTGELDEGTTDALIEYQKHSGLPVTGDLDERTRKQLWSDQDAIKKPVIAGGVSSLSISGGLLVAEGLWLKRGDSVNDLRWDSIQLAHVECRNYDGDRRCLDVYNVLNKMYQEDSTFPPADVVQSDLTQWDGNQVEAEYTSPFGGGGAHYWFDVKQSKATKALISESETKYYDLTDGQKIWKQLSQKQAQAEQEILLLRRPQGNAPATSE